ncbi:D-allose transporter substrate-binding protein [Pleomorphomonas sp. JP5]|uniref:D-allose transporter substrate-binding protein n=1 Tax=Pleomorphomonas sp. JP5 TaxID=2942998 RepID=UPI002044A907|nr:D-allose transporter substrate-binding protein [Pleomorphomonas sp. JP5]MCM5559400.1 D-allose transporter substrate-binding protein [Pleomorphomonas sp. JP5]
MKIRGLLIATVAAASVLGFSASAMAADYAIVLKTLSNPFWVQMKDGIEAKAKELGVEVDIVASPSEEDFQAQLQLFEDMLNRDYKAFGFAPLSPVNLVNPAAAAYKKGKPLVNIDEKVDMKALEAAGANVEAFVTTDNVKVGEKGAQFIIDQLGAEGGEVAIVEGKAGNASGQARHDGAKAAFEATSNVKLVASQPADWDRLKALDVATNILQSSPDLKAFYCANDTMALGVMQAVQNAGKAGKVLVVGTDGAPEAREMVAAGRLTATVAQDPAQIGATSLEILVEAVKAGKLTAVGAEPKQVAVDSVLVTK